MNDDFTLEEFDVWLVFCGEEHKPKTYAMNVPTGVIFRIAAYQQPAAMVFVPGIQVGKDKYGCPCTRATP